MGPTLGRCIIGACGFLILSFGSTRASSAGVVPADFVTITPIKAVGASAAETGYVGTSTSEGASPNATAFSQSLTTAKTASGAEYQFVAYYASTQNLVVGRREMLSTGWSDWYLRKTAFVANNVTDGHDVANIAVDGDGYLHLSWGMHDSDMNYTRSTTSVLNDNDFTLTGDTVGNAAGLGSAFPLNTAVTYPQFYNIPGSGDLLFGYRTDAGDGQMQLYRWNNATRIWSGVHASTSEPWINGDDPGGPLPNVIPYINGLVFDSKGVAHTTWTWRTGANSTSGYTDYQSNHNIMYARSPDAGANWYSQDGTLYARSGIHAIDQSNATPIVSLPEGSSLINQTSMAVGPDDDVYLASWWAPKAALGDQLRQYMLSWCDGSIWHTSQISDRSPEYVNSSGVSQRVPENLLGAYTMGRPAVAVDKDDRVIVAFDDWQRGGMISIAISESAQRNDWKMYYLDDVNMYGWEPTIDLSRWQDDDVLSMFYQPINGSAVSVLEWDAGAYFSATTVPEPSTIALLGVFAACACVVYWKTKRREATAIAT